MLVSILVYLLCGAIVGCLGGLLGIGGGAVIVPMLLAAFSLQGISSDYIQQMALGTSLASIMFTSITSARAHNAHGAVQWSIFKTITPGIMAGTFCGGLIAAHLSTNFLKLVFVFFLFAIGAEMLFNCKPRAMFHMPKAFGASVAGALIGVISSFVGIGGGTILVPFMLFCNVPMHTVVGTSAAIGFPLALSGTVSYIIGGWGAPSLPSSAIGFVNLWAVCGICAASWLTVPFGVRLSYILPTAKLKRFFAIFLILIAFKMLWDIIAG